MAIVLFFFFLCVCVCLLPFCSTSCIFVNEKASHIVLLPFCARFNDCFQKENNKNVFENKIYISHYTEKLPINFKSEFCFHLVLFHNCDIINMTYIHIYNFIFE